MASLLNINKEKLELHIEKLKGYVDDMDSEKTDEILDSIKTIYDLNNADDFTLIKRMLILSLRLLTSTINTVDHGEYTVEEIDILNDILVGLIE